MITHFVTAPFAAGAVSLFLTPFIHPKNVSRETFCFLFSKNCFT